jgi:hypothetical protein
LLALVPAALPTLVAFLAFLAVLLPLLVPLLAFLVLLLPLLALLPRFSPTALARFPPAASVPASAHAALLRSCRSRYRRSCTLQRCELRPSPPHLAVAPFFGLTFRYFTKAKDTRSPAFVARYGDVAVELDALPGRVLRERIEREVRERIDLEALEHARETERTDRERLDELLEG